MFVFPTSVRIFCTFLHEIAIFPPHRAQKEAEAKEKEQQERQRQKGLRHTEAVRQQVNERKKLAKAERRERFREADKMLEEAQQRQMHLNEIKEKKLKELR